MARDVYDELYVEEITESLARYSNESDKERFRSVGLIVAADVFVYSGEPEGVFASASQSLLSHFLLLLYYCFTTAFTGELERVFASASKSLRQGGLFAALLLLYYCKRCFNFAFTTALLLLYYCKRFQVAPAGRLVRYAT